MNEIIKTTVKNSKTLMLNTLTALKKPRASLPIMLRPFKTVMLTPHISTAETSALTDIRIVAGRIRTF